MRAENLRMISDDIKKNYASVFWNTYGAKFLEYMKEQANMGKDVCQIGFKTDWLNYEKWISTPHLRKEVIEQLEALGYTVKFFDSIDGEYIEIRW